MLRALHRLRLSGLFLGCFSVGCAAPAEESSGELSSRIAGGELDSEHPGVFGSVTLRDGNVSTCTASLIAPNLLLTARHCVSSVPSPEVVCGNSQFGEPVDPMDYIATNAIRLESSRTWFEAARMDVPSEGDDTCGFDIALVTLSSNVPASVAKPMVPRVDRGVTTGEQYTAVGYGIDVEGNIQGRMVLEGLEVQCNPGSCGSGVRVTEFRGSSGICEGDSGGPAIDMDGKVVGIVSRGASQCSDPVYGSVSAWSSFIRDVALAAADAGGYEAPFWVTTGMSDPPSEPVEPPSQPVEPPPTNPDPPPTNPDPPVETGGTQGDPCASASDCGSGYVCYKPDNSDEAFCVELCAANADCNTGLECTTVDNASVKVCRDRPDTTPTVKPPAKPAPDPTPSGEAGASGDDDGTGSFSTKSKASCAVSEPGTSSSSGLPALIGLALLLFRRRVFRI
jgi:MYXO-CTERM domain-containing protein